MTLASDADRLQPPPALTLRAREPIDALRAAFETAPHGVVVFERDGTILFVNDSASTIFGHPLGELIGQPLSRLVPGAAHDDRWTEFLRNADSARTMAWRNVSGLRQDGVTVPLEIGFSIFSSGAARCVIASIVDISERLTLEARLPAATKGHLEFQRLVTDVVTRFAAIDPDSVDNAIVDTLSRIGEALQLDFAVLWRWRSDGTSAQRPQHWVQSSHSLPEPFTTASIPFVIDSLKAGESCCFTRVDELPDPDREALRRHGVRSAAMVTLPSIGDGDCILSVLALGSRTREHEWTPGIIEHLRLIAGVISQALAQGAGRKALQQALDEIRRLRDHATLQHTTPRRPMMAVRPSVPIVTESAAIQHVLAQIEQVAPTPATVLLLGETGSGKQIMAQAIHDLSPRRQRQMITVSCAAIPTSLIESELFGREKGAYTGALSRQIGRFEAASQSTMFLDEVGDLPMEIQVKLLRVLQERTIERLGNPLPVKVDVRIIAATNRNLTDAIRDKTFREDLFYRLNVFPVVVPPLRERIADIPALVWSFIEEYSRLFGKTIESISSESLRELQRYSWPGNVRELRNVIERAVILATGAQLVVRIPRSVERLMPQDSMTLTQLEIEHIRAVLKSTGWRVRGVGGAAERLGLKPTTLESRMARFGIARAKAS